MLKSISKVFSRSKFVPAVFPLIALGICLAFIACGNGEHSPHVGHENSPQGFQEKEMAFSDCQSKIEDPAFVDPEPPSTLNAAEQQKWWKVLQISARLNKRKYFYRWGDPTFEDSRIGSDPIFNLSKAKGNDVNAGAMMAG